VTTFDESRLVAWRPTMTEYHRHPSISSGFLSAAHSEYGEGLSVALAERNDWLVRTAAGAEPTTKENLAAGITLHAWLEGDKETRIRVAHPRIKARRGEKWKAELSWARAVGAAALLLSEHHTKLCRAWDSLVGRDPSVDTGAKVAIRAMLRRWSPRHPEVSHAWEPFEGCVCRIRQDLIAKAPSGVWYAISIKTTETPLTPGRWWPFWTRHYRRSEAFYRAGLRDLFGSTPFRQLLVVARLVPPWPWAIFDLEERAEELDNSWEQDVLPQLKVITEGLAVGHGPEERGFA